jgi:hypothetical protein
VPVEIKERNVNCFVLLTTNQSIITLENEEVKMAKQFILYNLKDDVNEEDFVKFVNEFKGPFISGLPSVKRYTITSVKGAMQAKGGPPGPIETPYKLAAIVDLTSLKAYGKDAESQAYKEEFMPRFAKYVNEFLILRAEELYDNTSD